MVRVKFRASKEEDEFIKRRISSGWAETPQEVIRQALLWQKWENEHESWCPYKNKAKG